MSQNPSFDRDTTDCGSGMHSTTGSKSDKKLKCVAIKKVKNVFDSDI